MKKTLTLVLFMVFAINIKSQELYIKTFGSNKNKPLIFLHGGPGYNCVNFEVTTAELLANKGFFVIVYDRRGEGRSLDENAIFNFKEAFEDLHSIYAKHELKSATLIGHSFGGVLATLYYEQFPEKVQSVILVGAPVSLQETFKTIISKSKEIYLTKNDKVNLNYISMLENMDTSSIEYSSYCFAHAMANGFYSPKQYSDESKLLYSKFGTDTLLIKYAFQMTQDAPFGFWKNDHYTTINLYKNIQNIKSKGGKIFALYGKDDGLYSSAQVDDLKQLVGEGSLRYYDNCSHNVFIDQQKQFLDQISIWTN